MSKLILLAALFFLLNSSTAAQTMEEVINGANSPQQYKVKTTDGELAKLMKQRINVALTEQSHYLELRNHGMVSIGTTIASQKRLLNAKVEFHTAPEEIKAAYEEALKSAKATEAVVKNQFEEGADVSLQQVMEAMYFRLDVEIRFLKFTDALKK